MGKWRYSSIILNFRTRRRSSVGFTPQALDLVEADPRSQLLRRLGGPQSRLTYHGEEQNPLFLMRIESCTFSLQPCCYIKYMDVTIPPVYGHRNLNSRSVWQWPPLWSCGHLSLATGYRQSVCPETRRVQCLHPLSSSARLVRPFHDRPAASCHRIYSRSGPHSYFVLRRSPVHIAM
jgi:hypothetical protein